MSDTLGFRITADGCSWVCADCGKEFPLGGTLHLCEAKLPEEYRQLREQIATLTRERDEFAAALETALHRMSCPLTHCKECDAARLYNRPADALAAREERI